MAKFILALDQGTTATTAMVVGPDLSFLGKASNELPQIYPKPGWVEHDPEVIWQTTGKSAREAMQKAKVVSSDCAGIAITNQRETSIVWDRDTGKPRYNGIVWQCRRTADICAGLKNKGLEPMFRAKTGLVLDPYFSGTKVRWMLDNVDGLRADAVAGKVAFGTVDSYLIYRLTGGESHVTDVSNASRTLLLDLKTREFDADLCEALGVPMAMLPKVVPSAGVMGRTKGLDFMPDGVPVSGVAGDQQAALFGQTCFDTGQSKCTYGTGAFLLVNTGTTMIPSGHGLLTTIGWTVKGRTNYALEGSAFIAGAAVQWLRDGLGLIKTAPQVEALAETVSDSGGVVFVPAFAGLGAPYWRPDARGALSGLTRGTTAGHIARAVLEGVALQISALADAMVQDTGDPITELRVDGGASANNLLMQFQSDILGIPVVRPVNVDTTALGAAMLAGIGIDMWDQDELRRMAAVDRRFTPVFSSDEREARIDAYRTAVAKV